MVSSDSEGQTLPRKRSRASGSSEEVNSKKARGRPRVDTQDATAADRRRTQIRLAQRAYRQRKETTISSLKQQNARLQSIIGEMNKSFLRFNDYAVKSGFLSLSPDLTREFKNVTETFVKLAKDAADEGLEGDEETVESDISPAAELTKATAAARSSRDTYQTEQATQLPALEHTDIGWGYSASLVESPPPPPNIASSQTGTHTSSFFVPSPYETSKQTSLARVRRSGAMTVGQVLDQSRSREELRSNSAQLPFGLVDIGLDDPPSYPFNPQIFSATIPSPDLTPPPTRLSSPPSISQSIEPNLSTKTVASPWTYSFQEVSFARRLTRAALETGFHLLSSATLRPAALNYVFKLSLPYMKVEALRQRFKLMLTRGVHESLDCYDTPFIHLGGAGTHYPRKDEHGNPVKLPNAWNVKTTGSGRKILAENAVDPSLTHELDLDLIGFEGEWFDPYDVQGYLEEEKGLFIKPNDSFAEAYIEVEENKNPNNYLSFSNNTSVNPEMHDPNSAYPQQSPSLSNGSSSSGTLSDSSTPGTTVGIPDPMASRNSETPFGLDMNMTTFNDFGKFSEIDPATIFDQPLGLDLGGGFNTDTSGGLNQNINAFTNVDLSDMNLGLDLMNTGIGNLPIIKKKRKQLVWIDVTKLIDEIIKHGVCLGRAPGFRRKDVDMAFKNSLITAF